MGTRRGLSTRKIAIFAIFAIFSLACSSAASLSPESLRKRPGFAWKTGHSASFTYFFEASSSAERDIEKIKRGAEESRAHVLKLLGETSGSAPPVSVFIVETNQRMKDLGGNPGNAWSTDKLIAFVYGDRVKADGAHEDCHLMARHLWGSPHSDWLNEGLAVYSDDNWWGHPLHALARLMADRGELFPIATFQKNGWRKKSDLVTYPESGSFVKFLYEKYGVDAVRQLWQRGDGQIARIFGKSIDDLERQWRAAIATADATGIKYDVR